MAALNLIETAHAFAVAGYSVVPTRPDGTKAPVAFWKPYQQHPPTTGELIGWLTSGGYDGIGLVCGAVSGNLEMLELEGRAVAEGLGGQLGAALVEHGLLEVWTKLTAGYLERTPSGGLHWLYRVNGTANRNLKLARRPATAAELAEKPDERVKVLIETRGEGGYVVVAPSAGRTHPTGNAWTLVAGGIASIPTLSEDERDALHAVAATLDRMPTEQAPISAPGDNTKQNFGQRPGDDYNARVDWADILHGWIRVRTIGNGHGWRRPGKNRGISATTGTSSDGADRLYVFSTSTEFEAEKPYSKFAAYTLLHHGGNYAAAARTLRRNGYGTPLRLVADEPQNDPSTLVVEGATVRVVEPVTVERVVAAQGPTEDGTALALIEVHGHEIRYCPQRGQWLTWNGHRWTWDDAERVREFTRTIARALPEDSGWKNHKKRALSAAGVTGIIRHAQSDARAVVHLDHLDARPYELNTPAGIVDMTTGVIRPAEPGALHTRSTAFAPDFTRTSDLFTRFLTDTFGDQTALIAYIQRLLGVSAIGTVLEQLLPFAHGTGANGKSTLLESVMATLGRGETGYAIAAPAEMLMMRKHSEHPAEIAQLSGARLVVCSELDDGQRFAEARIKQLTGRDSINARFMRRNPFTFTPTHTIWLLGNHKPTTIAGGPAFWRRVRLLPFTRVVPEESRDVQLGEKLLVEAPAILAWIIAGAVDYRKKGLREPAAVKVATEEYAHDEDTVGRFVEEVCHRGGGSQVRVPMTDVRQRYEQWCFAESETPVSGKRLGQELRDRFGVGEAKSNGRKFYTGLTLLAGSDPGSDPAEDYREWIK